MLVLLVLTPAITMLDTSRSDSIIRTFIDLYTVWVSLSRGGTLPLKTEKAFWSGIPRHCCLELSKVCRFSARRSITVQIAIPLEVLAGTSVEGCDIQRHSCTGSSFVFVSWSFLSLVTSGGVKWLISLWSGSPNGRLQVTLAYQHFTWILQANGEPYLTRGESRIDD